MPDLTRFHLLTHPANDRPVSEQLWPPVLLFVIFKAAALVIVTAALDIAFWKSLIIAAVAASIGAAGSVTAGILAARIASREARRNRQLIEDVKGQVGADRRRTDETP